MGSVTLTINYPTAHETRILTALKTRFRNPDNSEPTTPELKILLEKEVASYLKSVVTSVEVNATVADVKANVDITDSTVTP